MSNATELLRRAADALRSELGPVPPYYIYGLIQELEECYLDTEKEAEPVYQFMLDFDTGIAWADVDKEIFSREGIQYQKRVLYTRPNPNPSESIKNQEVDRTRKPMREEEIFKLIKDNDRYCKVSFVCGIQAAEKHHGIGGGNE